MKFVVLTTSSLFVRGFLRVSLGLWAAVATVSGATYTVTSNADTGAVGTLRWAIGQANADAGSTIALSNNLGVIVLADSLPTITQAVTIEGGVGNSISGNDQHRIFFVNSASTAAVTFKNLTLTDGYAHGGNGGPGGGGGLGAGGAIFVNSGAVVVSGISFTGNSAIGGDGGAVGTFGGGGGMDADGSMSGGGGPYGGATAGVNSWGVPFQAVAGGDFSGGGGGNNSPGYGKGASGGWGGGGGSSGYSSAEALGGYGGGAGNLYFTAGYGGHTRSVLGGAAPPIWPYPPGTGSPAGGGGAGGGGAGGAIFVRADSGGSLTVQDSDFDAGSVAGGNVSFVDFWYNNYHFVATDEMRGRAAGSALFLTAGTTTISVSGGVKTIAGSIADGSIDRGESGGIIKSGAGTLVLSGNNHFSGGTTLSAGSVRLDHENALGGGGSISFAGGTLQYGAGVSKDVSPQISKGANQQFKIDTNGQNVTFGNGLVSAGGSLTKLGTGTLTLNAASSYSGPTVIAEGTLKLSPAGLVLRLEADEGVTLSGGQVSEWSDLSGWGNSATTGGGTVTVGSLSNGQTAMNFSDGAYLATPLNSSGASYSIFTVVEADALSGNQSLLGSSANGGLQFRLSGGNLQVLQQAVKVLATSSPVGSGPVLAGATVTSGTQALYSGSSVVGSGSTSFALSGGGSTFWLGNASHGEAFRGDIAAVLVYRAALTAAEVAQVQAYLQAKYFGGAAADLPDIGPLAATTELSLTGSGAALDLNRANQAVASLSGVAGSAIFLGGGSLTVGSNNASTTFAGSIRDSGGDSAATGGRLVKTGAGTLTLSGSNSHSGGTTIRGGAIHFSSDTNLGAQGASLTLDGGTLHNTTSIFDVSRPITLGAGGGTIALGSGGLTLLTGISGSGALTKTEGNILTLTGAQTYTGSTSVRGGMLKIEAGSLASPLVDVASGATLLFNNGGTFAGAITGGGTFTRSGSGITVYTGTATHTGGTVIDSGTLQIGNGGTAGRISGAITNNGLLAFQRSDAFFTVDNVISGSGGLLAAGGGVILSGSNSYSGTTTISSGALVVGFGGTTGTLGTGRVVNNGALLFGRNDAVTVGNVISGSGTVGMLGFGSLTLTGSNSYSGGTTVSFGTLNFAADENLGAPGSTVSLEGGTLHNTTDNFSSALRIVLGENGGTIALGSGGLTLKTAISGSGALTKTAGNILTLTGAQTYTGSTSVEGGTLKVEAGTLASPAVNIASGARILFSNGGTYAGAITGSGAFSREGTGVTVFTGTAAHSGGTFIDGGTLQVGTGDLAGSLGSGLITNNGRLAINRSGSAAISNTINGVGSVSVLGSGTVVFSGSNAYAGGTNIAAGTTRVTNRFAMGSGTVTVDGGVFVVDTTSAIANEVVLAGGAYQRVVTGNLAHAVDATSDLGRETTAQILGGTSGTSVTLNTAFSGTSLALNDGARISDVYSLEGTGTNTFVLQLSVDEVSATSYLGWLDEESGLWVNAVNGNTGGPTFFAGNRAYNSLTDFHLGYYGVDTANGTVWAVLNHNSEFAIIPEPSATILAGLGLLTLLRRPRR